MGTYNSTVLINGKHNDVATGQIINAIRTANLKTNRVIDGFVSRPLKSDDKPAHKGGSMKSTEVHKRPQRPRTLMRGGLKKPPPSIKNDISQRSSQPKITTQLRAKAISRHGMVERFGNPIKSYGAHSTVAALSGELVESARLEKSSVAAPLPSTLSSVSHQKLERLLDEAFAKADAHKEALRYQAARHFWQKRDLSGRAKWLATSAATVLIIAGVFLAWRDLPQLSVKIAGMRAHVAAAVPSYKPDGFVVASPAKAEAGTVTLKYKSAANDNQTYQIDQAPSHLTSTAISQNVIPKGTPVQTSQVDGNMVYIYGSSNDAAWVNNGVLYTIKDKADLSSDQLIKIVAGLNP